ncbi:hypothetical protein DSCW_12240 [Desulfosarcina widdelii]|uniref:Uncharacterized protein n=1 Tax=Desulfosarcina widdelii TaxID=947919 RepID=A0A5K7ZBU4_9BACT|nr:hypothetical protein DSCW_12240 [Desulfosarcina widdelii]
MTVVENNQQITACKWAFSERHDGPPIRQPWLDSFLSHLESDDYPAVMGRIDKSFSMYNRYGNQQPKYDHQ